MTVSNLDDSGEGSLRAAIRSSNDTPGADLIEFGPAAATGTIHLQSPLPTIHSVVDIVGPGANQLTVSGDSDGDGTPNVAILTVVGSAAKVRISGLTLAKGLGQSRGDDFDEDEGDREGGDSQHSHDYRRGGALSVAFGATITLEKVAIVDCVARKGAHGSHASGAEVDDGHESGFPAGAGIAVLLANLHIDSSLIASNGIDSEALPAGDDNEKGVGAGAAIFLVGSPLNEVTIRNSTISGNNAHSHSNGNAHSGAIYVSQLYGHDHELGEHEDDEDDEDFKFHSELDFGDEDEVGGEPDGSNQRFTVVLTNNTVADNTTVRGCAGLVVKNHRPMVILKNNIFARNVVDGEAEACNYRQRGGHPHAAAISRGGNIFDDASGNHFLTGHNDLTENPSLALGSLSQNGGPTATHALGETSSAIGNAVAGAPEFDQRCLARNEPPDSGAYEFGAGGEPVNTPPVVTAPIADVAANFGAPDLGFSVHPNFSDAQDPDTDLTYEVTANTVGGVVTTSSIDSADGVLTLGFAGPGVSEIEVTVTDTGGLSTSDRFTVTVGDTEKPVISGLPENISVPTDPGSETAIVDWTPPTATDNVAVTSFIGTHNPGDTFPLGSTTVTYTASDAAGNVCIAAFTVTVGDNEKPVISGLPADIVTTTDAGSPTATVSWTAPVASDNIAVTSFTSSHNPGGAFPAGVTTVTYTAADAAGNFCTAGFTVTVNDEEKPKINGLPDDIVAQAERGSTTAVVEWIEPTATDNVGVTSFTSNFTPGDAFPIGETVVTYTALDAAGNQCMASFLVTIEEPEGGFFLDFISVRTDPAPGTSGATFNTYSRAFINENDRVVFEGSVTDGDSTLANDRGIWFGDINGIDVSAREGDLAPGIGGGLVYGLFTSPNISDADEISFNSALIGAVTTISDLAHFSGQGTPAVNNRTREGNPAPGTGGVFKILHDPVAGSGVTAFSAHLDLIAPIGAASDTGVWSAQGGTLTQVAWEGSAVSAIPGATYGQISPAINMNEAGAVAFQTFVSGAGASNSAVLSGLPGSLAVVFKKSTVAPGTGGGSFLNFLATAIGGTGNVAVRANLFNSVALGIGAGNNDGIWAKVGGTVGLVAREGDQVPDQPPGVTFESFKEVSIADDGAVCFSGFLTGAGVNSANDGGLWSNASGSLRTLLREGDLAPGTDGCIIKSILRFSCNNNATVALVADLVPNIGDVASGTRQGLWISNPETAELDLALRTGMSFDFAPGDSRAINLITMDKSTNVFGGGGGGGRVLNDSDHLALILDFDLGSGVFITGRVTP